MITKASRIVIKAQLCKIDHHQADHPSKLCMKKRNEHLYLLWKFVIEPEIIGWKILFFVFKISRIFMTSLVHHSCLVFVRDSYTNTKHTETRVSIYLFTFRMR
jgi:hypothetical protein